MVRRFWVRASDILGPKALDEVWESIPPTKLYWLSGGLDRIQDELGCECVNPPRDLETWKPIIPEGIWGCYIWDRSEYSCSATDWSGTLYLIESADKGFLIVDEMEKPMHILLGYISKKDADAIYAWVLHYLDTGTADDSYTLEHMD